MGGTKEGLNVQFLLLKKLDMLFPSCTEKNRLFRIAGHLGVRSSKRKHLKFISPLFSGSWTSICSCSSSGWPHWSTQFQGKGKNFLTIPGWWHAHQSSPLSLSTQKQQICYVGQWPLGTLAGPKFSVCEPGSECKSWWRTNQCHETPIAAKRHNIIKCQLPFPSK